jgi:hypothetical protein
MRSSPRSSRVDRLPERLPEDRPGAAEMAPDASSDQAQTSYLVQTTGAFRQTPGGGGGPKSRCQTLPSSN